MSINVIESFELWILPCHSTHYARVGYMRKGTPDMDADFIYCLTDKVTPSISAIKKDYIDAFRVVATYAE